MLLSIHTRPLLGPRSRARSPPLDCIAIDRRRYLSGRDIGAYSNVVFSNGLLDPWSAAGVYGRDTGGAPPPPGAFAGPFVQNLTADGAMTALLLDLGAHHLDLMFMDDNDPPCADLARRVEADAIRGWIAEATGAAR